MHKVEKGVEFVGAGRAVSLADIFRSIGRAMGLIMICGFVAGVAAYVISIRLPEVYESSVTVLSSRAQASLGTPDLVAPPQVDPRVYNKAVFAGTVVASAVEAVTGAAITPQEAELFKKRISVSIENHDISSLITLKVKDSRPERSAAYADALAAQLVDWDRDRARHMLAETVTGLERAVSDLGSELERVSNSQSPDAAQQQAAIATLRDQRVRELASARLRSASVVAVGLLEVMNRAEVPVEPVEPRVLFNTFVAVVLGAMFGYAGSLFSTQLGAQRKEGSVTMGKLNLPVLAELPDMRSQFSEGLEELSILRTRLVGLVCKNLPVVVGFVSAGSRFDDDWIAASTAYALSRAGYRTLLIEADFGFPKSGFSNRFQGRDGPSLENSLQGQRLGEASGVVRVPSGKDSSFDLLPTRSVLADASEALIRDFKALMTGFKERYDIVLVSVPPTTREVDLTTAALTFDATVLIVNRSVRVADVDDRSELLHEDGVRLLGVVISRRAKVKGIDQDRLSSTLPWMVGEGGG